MWHISKVRRATGSGNDRVHKAVGRRPRGFSHPARFEALEPRMALNVAPVTPSVGAGSASGASTGTAVGSNPASFSPANTTGSGTASEGNVLDNQQVAFNSPYWLPNDRPPFAFPPADQLPANVNQAASMPQGIRNFNLGADTSTHFTTSGVTLTVLRPRSDTGGNRVASGSRDDTLPVETWLGMEPLGSQDKDAAVTEPRDEVPSPHADDGREGVAHRERLHLEPSAVDWMMGDESKADTARPDAAIAELVADDPAGEPGVGPVAYSLAASLALATSAPVREHVWSKSQSSSSGKRRRAAGW